MTGTASLPPLSGTPPAAPLPVPDVFISYAREDRALAQALAAALQAAGLVAWWDREIPLGHDFAEVIAHNLASARMTCVLWSADAVQSSFVRDEAARARDVGRLLPVRIEDVTLPLGFGTLQTLDLLDWDGDADDAACQAVVAEIRRALAPGGHLPNGSAVPRSRRPRWRRWIGWLALAALMGSGVAVGGWHVAQTREARFHLGEGLKAQFARDPNLQAARSEYLFALEANPDLASARYYLGHVYAQLDLPADAHAQFLAALQIGEGLDGDQRREATKLLQTLQPEAEPAALAGTTAARSSPRPAPHTTAAAASAGAVAARPDVAPTLTRLADLAQRVAPQAELQRDVSRHVQALFAADPQVRLNATTALALAPSENSDAVPLAIAASLAGLARDPGDGIVRSGVNATLVLLQNASALSLAFGHTEVERLLDIASPLSPALKLSADKVRARLATAAQHRPQVYLQIADEAQRPLAQAVSQRLIDAGYDVPGIERVATNRAPARSEIRVQGTSHLGLGRWQLRQLQELLGDAPALQVLRKVSPAVDTYEIWFDKGLCVAPGPQPAGCGG